MLKILKQKLVLIRNYLIYKRLDVLAKINHTKFRTNPAANFVVSIASYPKRSHLLPAVFEALNRQTVVPKKWLLVLSEEEWPKLELPRYLEKLVNRGLEIVWVKNNPFAVKKLVPVIEKYPNLDVITFDDELIYGKHVIEQLINCSLNHKNAIIGHVGKRLIQKKGELRMAYRASTNADYNTRSEEVYFLGGSGTYYPAGSLHPKVMELEAIRKIVPGRGSDIWFWAAAIAKGSEQICLGTYTRINLYFAIPSTKDTEPKDTPGGDIMEKRFQMAIDYFDIREKLLSRLPNEA